MLNYFQFCQYPCRILDTNTNGNYETKQITFYPNLKSVARQLVFKKHFCIHSCFPHYLNCFFLCICP